MSTLLVLSASAVAPFGAIPVYGANEQIEEIIVTAEKRETVAQETAVALTAYDAHELEARGIHDIQDLQFNVPNLIISPNSQSPVTYAYIRGIGSDQLVARLHPGVAYHLHGRYLRPPS